MNIESQIGIRHTDIGALSFALHKIVDNGVFHLVSDEFRVAKFGAVDGGVDAKDVSRSKKSFHSISFTALYTSSALRARNGK